MMPRHRVPLLAALALLAAVLVAPSGATAAPAPAATLSTNVHLFYYPWYGAANGAYRHWPQGGHTPPADIGANLYPKLGPYDSGDFAGAVDQHMRWVVQSG